MIGILAREQWRFQRLYIVWAAAIVAAAVGFATFATLSASTQGALDRFSLRVELNDAPLASQIVLTDPGYTVPATDDYGFAMPSAAIDSMIDDANADGAGAVAYTWAQGYIVPGSGVDPQASYSEWPTVYAVWGDVDWSAILAEGSAPGTNDIVLPVAAARERHVGIGDTVMVGHTADSDSSTWEFAPDATLTVSGLAYDISHYGWGGPAYVNPDQLPAITAMSAAMWAQGGSETDPQPVQVTVSWHHPSAALDGLDTYTNFGVSRTFGSSPALAWLLAGLFTVGAIVTAFTLGRAQAQSRVRWVATARTLGARRAHLLGVAGLEWATVGAAGAAVGILGGWASALGAYALRMRDVTDPPPVTLSVPAFVIALMILLAALLAAAVVAVPSVLAVRVPPTAAFKSIPAADTVTISRRVPFWPVVVIFAVSWLATAAAGRANFDGLAWGGLWGLAATVSGIAVLVESCRALVRGTAARLSRSHRPWAIHASMTMAGHPQQAAALAIIQALLMTGLSGFIVSSQPQQFSFGWYSYQPLSSLFWFNDITVFLGQLIPAPLSIHAVVLLLVAAQALALAISFSSRRVAWAESSTAGALGLTGGAARRGDAAAWWLAQAHGAWVGLCAGIVGVGGIWLATISWVDQPLVESPVQELPRRVIAAALVALTSLLIAACVAALAAIALRPRHATRPAPAS